MRKSELIIALFAALWLSGCATIVSGYDYPVSIQSTPPNAEYEVVDRSGVIIHAGQTPETITLAAGDGYFKRASYTLNFKFEGEVVKTVPVSASFDGWYVGNVVFGGLIGILIVDPATGAMYSLPKAVATDLTKELQTAEKDKPELQVMDINYLPETYRDQLITVAE